jgi:N-acetylglucosaminyl-diphospho-decaprenol L-rhamnosyltransferase
VDNGSTDGSVDAARSEIGEIEILRLGTNVGFGTALNRAVRERPSETLIFLNNDVECEQTFVEAMLDELSPETEMVAGVLLQTAGDVIDSAGIVIDSTLMGFDYLHGEKVDVLANSPAPIGPTGGAALVRSAAFAAVGGFDERIFAYQEDVDLVLRLRSAGATCRLAHEARCVHRHSATLGSGSARKNWYMGWSRGYLLRRYRVLKQPRRAARALAADAVICAGQALIDHTLTGVSGRVHGWRAAAHVPRMEIPEADLIQISLRQALAWRGQRRSMPWRPRKPDGATA